MLKSLLKMIMKEIFVVRHFRFQSLTRMITKENHYFWCDPVGMHHLLDEIFKIHSIKMYLVIENTR